MKVYNSVNEHVQIWTNVKKRS